MARASRVKDSRLKGLGGRLQQLAEAHGGITGLAKKANVAASSLSRCANGIGEPSLSMALAVCTATDADLNWLTTGDQASSPSADRIQIPFFDIEASAGPGIHPGENETAASIVSIPSGLLHRMTARNLCAIQSKGDSMEPTIRNGSMLIVDRSDQQIRDGIFVISRGDVLLVKRLQPRENSILRLKSDNDRYEPEDIPLNDASQNLHIIGRVIWSGHGI
jgi:phage repressor protein C with HTH and peptisase S24 domain